MGVPAGYPLGQRPPAPLQVFARVRELLGVRRIATSSSHPSGNGDVYRVNNTMAQMLAMVVNERQDDWDTQLPHVELAYTNSASAATGLAPNEGLVPAPPSYYCRPLRGRRPSELGPRPPRMLQPGIGTPTVRQRYCSVNVCFDSFVWNGETQPVRMHCVRSPTLWWVLGLGCTMRPPPFAKARRPALTRRCSRPSFRSI